MLTKLPPEVFSRMVEKLRKPDLKALSQVSGYVHGCVAKALWQSITIEPQTEFDLHRIVISALPQTCLQLATQLHFRSNIKYATERRCPHFWDLDDEPDSEYEDECQCCIDRPRFDRLAQKAEFLIGRLEDNQLHSFSWDLGTCVPSEILGTNGIVPLNHPLIRSLSLTTDFSCFGCGCTEPEPDIDLSPFRQLQSLSWRAPQFHHLDTLSVAIRSNAAHLQKLELDFVNWQELFECLDDDSDDEYEDGNTAQHYFCRVILGWNEHSPRPLLPAISALSLSQVPVMPPAMTHVINFSNLVSLTLRMCPAWDLFLDQVVQLNLPIKLKTLEIQDSYSVSDWFSEGILNGFLDAFEGLEELFVSQSGPITALEFWEHVAHHHGTLKRFVHHQRVLNVYEESPLFEQEVEYDLPDLGIGRRDMRLIREDPSQNPLTTLDLECIGLGCMPERLKYLLLPFVAKKSLRVLHIRQSISDLKYYASWAMKAASGTRRASSPESSGSTSWNDSGTTSPISEMEDVSFVSDIEGGGNVHGLRDKFRQFAEWIFGPHGISSLHIVAFGDFAHGGRETRNNLLLCRNTDGKSKFRLLDEYEPEWTEVRDKYRSTIEACPVEPLLGGLNQ